MDEFGMRVAQVVLQIESIEETVQVKSLILVQGNGQILQMHRRLLAEWLGLATVADHASHQQQHH